MDTISSGHALVRSNFNVRNFWQILKIDYLFFVFFKDLLYNEMKKNVQGVRKRVSE